MMYVALRVCVAVAPGAGAGEFDGSEDVAVVGLRRPDEERRGRAAPVREGVRRGTRCAIVRGPAGDTGRDCELKSMKEAFNPFPVLPCDHC